MTRSLRIQACAQWWRALGDDVKPYLGTWRECHPTFQLTKHWDYRSRHQSVDDLTAIGSAALVVLATAGSTNSVRAISAHLLTWRVLGCRNCSTNFLCNASEASVAVSLYDNHNVNIIKEKKLQHYTTQQGINEHSEFRQENNLL